MDTEDANAGSEHGQTSTTEQEPDAKKRRQAIAITSLGSVADLTAIAQLVTSTAKLGALVFGLLSVAISCMGLIRLWGNDLGRPVAGMVVLLIIGSGATGIALGGSWNQTPSSGEQPPAGSSPTETASAETSAPASSLQSPPSGVAGTVLRDGKLDLRSGDVADLEKGTVSNSGLRSDVTYSYSDGIDYAFLAISAAGPDHYMSQAPQSPTFEQCVSILKVRHDRAEKVASPGVGAWYCIGTDDYNVAAVQVQKLPTGAQDSITISYELWKG